MKKFVFVIAAMTALFNCSAQRGEIGLIVRGDDMGYAHSGNEALIQCFQNGIQRTIEVIVPSPWFPEAVKLLKQNPTVDVGVHLALTSEWDNVKWRPVSNAPSITDSDGYFFPFIWANPNYPGQALKEHQWKIEDVEKEFRAQIELAKKHIPQVSHISAHMGCTDMTDEVSKLAKRLAVEYKIDIDLKELGVKNTSYEGPRKTLAEKKSSFLKMLDKLEAGNDYLFVDHPGLDTPELRAISHKGYEDVAADRQGVTSLWTDKDVMEAIKKKGIKLKAYRDLKNQ
jgi:chitin disaccharide deacetylase